MMDALNFKSMINHCIQKTILCGDGQSAFITKNMVNSIKYLYAITTIIIILYYYIYIYTTAGKLE